MLCLKKCMCSYKTTVICGQTSWPVRGEGDKSETVIFSLCPSCLLYAVPFASLGRGVLALSPGPPTAEDMFSVCLTQCIFNELRLPSALLSVGLNGTSQKTFRSHIVQALGSINNSVTKKSRLCVCVCKRFLQLEQEHELI